MKRGLVDLTTFLVLFVPIVIAVATIYFEFQSVTNIMNTLASKFNQIILIKGSCSVSVIRQA